MPRPSTRQRQERFIREFEYAPHNRSVEDYISRRLGRHGLSWLTDEQIADIASDMVERERLSHGLLIRNRIALTRAAA